MSNRKRAPKHPSWRAMNADTSAQAERAQLQFFKEAPAWRKLAIAADLTSGVLALSERGFKERNPGLTCEELRFLLAKQRLGAELAQKFYGCLEKADTKSCDDS